MKVLGWIVACAAVLAVTTAAGAEASRPASEASRPGVWLHHAVIVDLRNLPKRYTCDELWYKFKDVLLAIGARPDMKILPYRCEQRLGAAARSPSVELIFSMPAQATPKNVRWADVQVVPKSVRLQPGAPSHLDSQDCALLKQMKDTLLSNIGAVVTDFHLACNAPPSPSNPTFSMTVEALAASSQAPGRLAAAAPTNSSAPARE
jgi:hypothetical protein